MFHHLTITGNGIIENTYGGVPSGADGPCAISMTSFSSRITIGNNTDTETSAGLKFYGTVKYSSYIPIGDEYISNADIFGGWFKYKSDAYNERKVQRYDA